MADHFFEKNEDYNKLVEENNVLKKKIEELEQKLKKYTNGDNHKRYYEKIKEYNHNAYMKEKQKLLKEKVEQMSNPDMEINTILATPN
jgi:predicted MPP superfamily phosphohydrolase